MDDSLAARFNGVQLDSDDDGNASHPFQPHPSVRLAPTPRYLFRVFTPKSRGLTSPSWAVSACALSDPSSDLVLDRRVPASASTVTTDVFRMEKRQAAGMISRHLQWRDNPADNLVSWTSSLPFALFYMFHLYASHRDGSAFSDIKICIIDTTLFPDQVFIRDKDLIDAFRDYDRSLDGFANLRRTRDPDLGSYSYFGEHLSQGFLDIQSKCQVVSAHDLIDHGLYQLLPQLRNFQEGLSTSSIPWAKEVMQLRRDLYIHPLLVLEMGSATERRKAALSIASLFRPPWRMPMAIRLITMVTDLWDTEETLKIFRRASFTGLSFLISKTESLGNIVRLIWNN